ncbi:MAG: aminotransferase class I/II-fold pyridoxal phosphate-dependent enzyme [Lachnospirales bacterium]
MSYVNEKVRNIPYSEIRKFFDVAKSMEGVVSLGVGEPDFYTPWSIRQEAIKTLEKRRTAYTSNAGLLEFRYEIAKYLHNTIGVKYSHENEVMVTVGASEAIDVAFRTILDQGDEVLVVEPSYVSYRPCVILAGGVPVVIATKNENNFKLTAEEIKENITRKTKAIIISYPNNPTGAIMTKEDLEGIRDIIIEKDLVVISDEIYSELTYGKNHVSISSLDGMRERTIVINGFSKAFSMTGWRLGYAAGPSDIISNMVKVHQYVIMCASTVAQYAGREALIGCMDKVYDMREEYNMRRRLMLKGFERMGLPCFEPEGAFYLFPSIKGLNMTSEEFCTELLTKEKLAIVPGNAFGDCGEGHIRCSYAYSIDNLREALVRLERFVNNLKK